MMANDKIIQGWTSMSILREIVYFAVERGGELQEILAHANLTQDDLNNIQLKVSKEDTNLLWIKAIELTNDPFLGLKLGQHSSPAVLGIVGHLYQTCPNIYEGMLNLQKFNVLFGDLIQIKVLEEDNLVGLSFEVNGIDKHMSKSLRNAIDAWMSACVNTFRKVAAGSPRPHAVWMSLPDKNIIGIYKEILQIESIQIHAYSNVVWYKRDAVKMPLITYNPGLYQHMLMLANEELESFYGAKNFTKRVEDLLHQEYKNGFPGIEQIASRMYMTPRTIQRKLRTEGYTFSEIIEKSKQNLAFQLLKSRRYNVSEIAFKLGFSEPGSFTRTFKKWTGKCPKQYLN